jgi:hypothetical protein
MCIFLCGGMELALGSKAHYRREFHPVSIRGTLAVLARHLAGLRRAKGGKRENGSEGGELHLV